MSLGSFSRKRQDPLTINASQSMWDSAEIALESSVFKYTKSFLARFSSYFYNSLENRMPYANSIITKLTGRTKFKSHSKCFRMLRSHSTMASKLGIKLNSFFGLRSSCREMYSRRCLS